MSFFKLTFKSSRRINETKRWWKHVGQQPRRTGLHSPSDDIVRGTSAGGGLPPVGNCGPHKVILQETTATIGRWHCTNYIIPAVEPITRVNDSAILLWPIFFTFLEFGN